MIRLDPFKSRLIETITILTAVAIAFMVPALKANASLHLINQLRDRLIDAINIEIPRSNSIRLCDWYEKNPYFYNLYCTVQKEVK